MAINTREELADYCLRKLGAPVLDIVLDEEQINDAIEDALEFFMEFHTDGSIKDYLKHQITANQLDISNATAFKVGEIVTGSVSNATVKILKLKDNGALWTDVATGTFTIGETITGQESGATGTITGYTIGDIERGWIPCDDSILSVTKIFPLGDSASSTNNLFNMRFQLKLADLYSLQQAQVVQFEQVQQHINTMEMVMVGDKQFRFNRRMNKIFIDFNWKEDAIIGEWIVAEVYRALDPEEFKGIYNDRGIKRLCVANMKVRWATNISLYSGLALPGGVTLNGQQMLEQANEELEAAYQNIRDVYEQPMMMMVG